MSAGGGWAMRHFLLGAASGDAIGGNAAFTLALQKRHTSKTAARAQGHVTTS